MSLTSKATRFEVDYDLNNHWNEGANDYAQFHLSLALDW